MRLFLSKTVLVVWLFQIVSGASTTESPNSEPSVTMALETSTDEYYEPDDDETQTSKPSKSTINTNTILFAIAGALVVSGGIVSFTLWMLSRRARAKLADEEVETGVSPQKMDSEAINLSEFQDKGPLVLQARMKGRIKHALDDDKSFSLKEVQFHPQYNEICIIGSDVEQLEGKIKHLFKMSQLSMLSGEKSAELAKASKGGKKGAYPTMASEMKRREAEAAAREAARVRENERRIAESAIRRRARDAAAAAAAAQTPSDKEKQETPSSDVPSSLDKTQHSQKSISRRTTRSRHDSVQRPPPSPYQLPRLTPEDHRKPRAPVALRKRPSNDGRHPDALGASRIKSSPSSSSKQTPDDSRSQKTSSTKSEVKSVSSTKSEVRSGPSVKSQVNSVQSGPSIKSEVKSVPSPQSEEKSWSGPPRPAPPSRQDQFVRRKSSRS